MKMDRDKLLLETARAAEFTLRMVAAASMHRATLEERADDLQRNIRRFELPSEGKSWQAATLSEREAAMISAAEGRLDAVAKRAAERLRGASVMDQLQAIASKYDLKPVGSNPHERLLAALSEAHDLGSGAKRHENQS